MIAKSFKLLMILILAFYFAGCINYFQTTIDERAIQNSSIILNFENTTYIDQLQTEDNMVVWTANDGIDYEIYYWNGSFDFNGVPNNILKITNNSYRDFEPRIYAGKLVWLGYEDKNPQVHYWNGSFKDDGEPTDSIRLSHGNYSVDYPEIF